MSEYIPHRVREWSQEDLGTIAANAAAVFAVVSQGPSDANSLINVGIPVVCSAITTANNARSLPRRRSKILGQKLPCRSFGIASSTSPALVVANFGRIPLR